MNSAWLLGSWSLAEIWTVFTTVVGSTFSNVLGILTVAIPVIMLVLVFKYVKKYFAAKA